MITKIHIHFKEPVKLYLNMLKLGIYFLLIFILLWLFIGCVGKTNKLISNMGYLEQDNKGIIICRIDETGGKICEYNIDYFERKHQKVIINSIPKN